MMKKMLKNEHGDVSGPDLNIIAIVFFGVIILVLAFIGLFNGWWRPLPP